MVSFPASELSLHLFWDTDPDQVDFQQHAVWLTKRVLEYGRWRNWQILLKTYGKPRLAEIVGSLRSLDPRAAAFCRAYFSLSDSSLPCSTSIPFRTPSASC